LTFQSFSEFMDGASACSWPLIPSMMNKKQNFNRTRHHQQVQGFCRTQGVVSPPSTGSRGGTGHTAHRRPAPAASSIQPLLATRSAGRSQQSTLHWPGPAARPLLPKNGRAAPVPYAPRNAGTRPGPRWPDPSGLADTTCWH